VEREGRGRDHRFQAPQRPDGQGQPGLPRTPDQVRQHGPPLATVGPRPKSSRHQNPYAARVSRADTHPVAEWKRAGPRVRAHTWPTLPWYERPWGIPAVV